MRIDSVNQRESCAGQVRSLERVLASFAGRNELMFDKHGVQRCGKVKYHVSWPGSRSLLLVLDFDAGELCFPRLICGLDTRAEWFKNWNARHRRGSADEIAVIVRRGALSLHMTVRDGAVARCAEAILHAAKRIVAEVTGAQRIAALRQADSRGPRLFDRVDTNMAANRHGEVRVWRDYEERT